MIGRACQALKFSDSTLCFAIGWCAVSAAAVLLACQHFLGLLMIGPLLGSAQWVFARRLGRGISFRWVLIHAMGWQVALAMIALVEAVLSPLGQVLSASVATVIGGVALGVLQRWAVRQYCQIGWLRGAVTGFLSTAFLIVLPRLLFEAVVPELPVGFSIPSGPTVPGHFIATHLLVCGCAGGGSALIVMLGLRLDKASGPPIKQRSTWRKIVGLTPDVLAALMLLFLVWDVASVPTSVAELPEETLSLSEPAGTLKSAEQGDGWQVQTYEFNNASGHPYSVYFFASASAGSATPLVVYLHGSGWQSAFGFTKRKLAPFVAERSFALLTLDKVGVARSEGASPPQPNAEFYAHDYKQERLRNTNQAIDAFSSSHGPFASVHVIGHSEGADVAPIVARTRTDVDSVVVMAGGGLAQSDEARILLKGILRTPSELLNRIEARLIDRYVWAETMRVIANPSSHEFLMGLSYKRWRSYMTSAPVEDLLMFDGPILSVHGGQDQNSPVETSLYTAARHRDAGRRNHTLKVYPELDHSYRDAEGDDRIGSVFDFVFDWICETSSTACRNE